MKHIIKVESLDSLSEIRPLVAMDANGNLKWLIAEVDPDVPSNQIWYTSNNGEIV